MKQGEVTKELEEIYRNAYEDNIWLKEFSPTSSEGCFLAAAGCFIELKEIQKRTGLEIDIEMLTLGDCVNLSYPGTGDTREEACKTAIKKFKKYYVEHEESHRVSIIKENKEK